MSKISDLASALHEKTMEKKIKWDIVDDSSITTNIGANSIIINRMLDEDLDYYYDFAVQNMSGITVDEETFFKDKGIHRWLAEIMVMAKRDSLQADETLDEIMEKVSRL